ncbi:MAG: hypothetical protein GY756_10180 [bacterium]|nr:hypothetical protein [bacterium]
MSNFRVGQKVKVKGYKGLGVITKLTDSGEPREVVIGDKIINVINEVVKVVSVFKALWLIIKSIFK